MGRWVVGLLLALNACGPTTQGDHWIMTGQLSDGPDTYFVNVTPGFEKSKPVYNQAVRSLCPENYCRVLFFLPADPRPASTSLKTFFSNGGFGQHRTLATWLGTRDKGQFTQWDCERAGVENAPLNALCGEGVLEDYRAVLALASRAGQTYACDWETTNDADLTRRFIASLRDDERRAQFQRDFDKMYGGGNSRPDDLSQCGAVKQRTQPDVDQARLRFRSHLPMIR